MTCSPINRPSDRIRAELKQFEIETNSILRSWYEGEITHLEIGGVNPSSFSDDDIQEIVRRKCDLTTDLIRAEQDEYMAHMDSIKAGFYHD